MHFIAKKHGISGLRNRAAIGAFMFVTGGATALAQAQTPAAPAMPMSHSKMGADKSMPAMPATPAMPGMEVRWRT